jgi:hypothetical protein
MLVGNKVLDWWAGKSQLDPSSAAGWLAGAKAFWLMPAGIALVVTVIFFLAFREKEEANVER